MAKTFNFKDKTIFTIGSCISSDGSVKLAIKCKKQRFAKYWEDVYIFSKMLKPIQETKCQN